MNMNANVQIEVVYRCRAPRTSGTVWTRSTAAASGRCCCSRCCRRFWGERSARRSDPSPSSCWRSAAGPQWTLWQEDRQHTEQNLDQTGQHTEQTEPENLIVTAVLGRIFNINTQEREKCWEFSEPAGVSSPSDSESSSPSCKFSI